MICFEEKLNSLCIESGRIINTMGQDPVSYWLYNSEKVKLYMAIIDNIYSPTKGLVTNPREINNTYA